MFCLLVNKPLRSKLTRFLIAASVIIITSGSMQAQTIALTPTADAYVRGGTFSDINYGTDTALAVKSTVTAKFTRLSYLKFSLGNTAVVRSAKLRLYGSNTDNAASVNVSVFSADDDNWTEKGITFNNAPASTSFLVAEGVNNVAGYYEFDVTDFVISQLSTDNLVTLVLKDTASRDKNVIFNSKEYGQNLPQLVIDITPLPQPVVTLSPTADAYVRNGTFGNTNFGSDTALIVKSSVTNGFTRQSYLKFSINTIHAVKSAKLRLYGANKDNAATVNVALFGVSNDSWSEDGITFNNAPGASSFLSSAGVNNIGGYYEYDVTTFVNNQLKGDKILSFLLKDTANRDKNIVFNSKEYGQSLPQLLIDTSSVPLPVIIPPIADAYVRDGTFGEVNFGSEESLVVKSTPVAGLNRSSYLKFSLGSLTYIRSAKVRLYMSAKDNTATLQVPLFGINNDSWTEGGITFNNAPAPTSPSLSTAGINNVPGYYEFDVTDFVKEELTGDKLVSFVLKDTLFKNSNITFNSKENSQNPPELVIDTAISNALLFVQNMDGFPSNDHVVFAHIQVPWTRDTVYNANHDSVKIRLHNYGINPLIISKLKISVDTLWKIDKLNGSNFNPLTQLPATVNPGGSLDLMVKFIANKVGNKTTRAKILHETLTISSNDDKAPNKKVYLDGLWQFSGEGLHEPFLQEMISTFGFKTNVGFGFKDPDLGDTTKLKGDEIKPDFFLQADANIPITIRQIAAYHGCCHQQEYFKWFSKENTDVHNPVFFHVEVDAQTLLPRRSLNGNPAAGTMNVSGPFGVIIGPGNTTLAYLNNPKQFGVRVYKAVDPSGNVIPNTYFLASDYLGNESNHDYNDNVYYVTNIKPYQGAVYHSPLNVTPSALDFGEKILQTNSSLLLNISSGGKTYSNGSQDPPIVISSVVITGENEAEFSAEMPLKTTLNPQQATTIKVDFKPASQGLKIADMLIYYSNSKSPKRVPLYGIAKAKGVTVTADYRINSGATAPVTIRGKKWETDSAYAFDNLAPLKNTAVKGISATDEDALYLDAQSTKNDKKPFRYQMPLANGTYYVRLHFAEITWGVPGAGLTGGAGSRVFSVKLENQYRLTNYDVTQDVGAGSAVIKNFIVTVSDKMLNIDFSAVVNKALISAVEVYSFSSPDVAARPATTAENTNPSMIYRNKQVSAKPGVYPNPLFNKNLNVHFPPNYAGIYSLQLVDVIGKKYNLGKRKLSGGGVDLKVDISHLSLKAGVYYLKINSDSNKSDVIKLLIQ